jgi:hypothetical protein
MGKTSFGSNQLRKLGSDRVQIRNPTTGMRIDYDFGKTNMKNFPLPSFPLA